MTQFIVRAILPTLLITSGTAATAQQNQDVHPGKRVYASASEWTATAPGSIPVTNFQPFRAVYGRVYRDANGERRADRIIVMAERVAWGPTPSILVTLIDTGSSDYDDTTARIQTRIFAEDSQGLFFQVAPAPGSARDYLLLHATADTVRATAVSAETGRGMRRNLPVATPQLGTPALWIVGSMDLTDDARIRFSAADIPAPSSTFGARPFIVAGRDHIDTPSGQVEAWVVQYPLGMTSPRVMRTYVTNRPPYLLGKKPLNLDTGETTEIGTLRLLEFHSFSDEHR